MPAFDKNTGSSEKMVLWEQGGVSRGISLYLSGTEVGEKPVSAEIYFHAWNVVTSDGVGDGWGGPASPVFAAGKVERGKLYHAVLVMDGDDSDLNAGVIRGYLNGQQVQDPAASSVGAGLLYNHSDDTGLGAVNYNTVYHDGNKAATFFADPFDGTIDEVALYNKALSAERIKVHFNIGTTSIEPPQVALTSPAEGATFLAGASIAITATATAAAERTIKKVEFLASGNKIGEATSSPFMLNVSTLSDGPYNLTARATDSHGLATESAPVNILVGSPPETIVLFTFNDNTKWSYNREGIDLGTAWREVKYDESKWPTGLGPLGDNSDHTEAVPIRTFVSRTTDGGDPYPTLYIRGHFHFPRNSTTGVTLSLTCMIDDGAVFYLNGVEVFRTTFGGAVGGFGTAPITFETLYNPGHEAAQ